MLEPQDLAELTGLDPNRVKPLKCQAPVKGRTSCLLVQAFCQAPGEASHCEENFLRGFPFDGSLVSKGGCRGDTGILNTVPWFTFSGIFPSGNFQVEPRYLTKSVELIVAKPPGEPLLELDPWCLQQPIDLPFQRSTGVCKGPGLREMVIGLGFRTLQMFRGTRAVGVSSTQALCCPPTDPVFSSDLAVKCRCRSYCGPTSAVTEAIPPSHRAVPSLKSLPSPDSPLVPSPRDQPGAGTAQALWDQPRVSSCISGSV